MSFRYPRKRLAGGQVYFKGPPRKRYGTGYASKPLYRRSNAIKSANRRAALNQRTGGYLGIEKKFLDTAFSGALTAPTDATGGETDPSTFLSLTSIAQGDGESNRDGRKCMVQSVYVTGIILQAALVNQTTPKTSTNCCVYLVQDTQTCGAQLDSEKVFVNPGGISNTASNLLHNLQYSSRFKVLDKAMIDMSQMQTSWDGTNLEQNGNQYPFTLSWSGAMPVTFSNTTGVIANVVDNSIHVIAFCGNTGTVPTLQYNARCRFTG